MCQNGAFVTNLMIECRKPPIDTTFQTGTGSCSNRIYPGEPVFGAELHRIIANSSMRCSGFFAPARRGETCRSRMGGGKTPIDAFAVGARSVAIAGGLAPSARIKGTSSLMSGKETLRGNGILCAERRKQQNARPSPLPPDRKSVV